MSEVRVFGIRHHGPGSAASLLAALEAFIPDLVLLECPADAQEALVHVEDERLKPPVALLIFNPKDHKQAGFFPFATFSPEWEAIRYCQRNGTHLRAFDLPLGMQFSISEEMAKRPVAATSSEAKKEAPELSVDPLSHIGEIAGYSDGERWWEVELEQRVGTAEVFTAVNDLMGSLRTELARPESDDTLLREAYMREQIRAGVKAGYPKIAIVCGAWHAPVMDVDLLKKEDKARLKGIKKLNTQSTWIPWTYERLSFSSGYGAGVLSPAWYELLYSAPRAELVTQWMVRAAQLLRANDLDASSAHAIEAVRLAGMLASIRGQVLPGIDELQEAATTIFGGGHSERINIIHRKLVIGDAMGEVPEALATTPLQQDLIAQQKKTKLKPTAEDKRIELDLRTELHLEKSHLLHRLRLLDIPWGDPQRVSGKSGTFHEHWSLSWRPEFALSVVEAGLWGNTILEAASRRTEQRAAETTSIEVLSDLIEAALQADLAPSMPALVARLEALSASARDVTHLMGALPPLVGVMRYGNVRRTDTEQVGQVVHKLVPRICISLPGACTGIDHDAASALLERIKAVDRAIRLLQEPEHLEAWLRTLQEIGHSTTANGLLSGAAVRSLFDANELDAEATATLLGLALSPANPVEHSTAWIEGFLGESGLLLIHDPRLFQLIDEWVATLPEEVFKETVPLLRRTFSRFSIPERVQLLGLVGGVGRKQQQAEASIDMERAQRVLPILRQFLGFTETDEQVKP